MEKVTQDGSALKKLRQEKGLSQGELAVKLGIHQSQLSLLEKNKRAITLGTFIKLSDILKVEVSELLNRLGYRKENEA